MTPTELHRILLAHHDAQTRTLSLPASAFWGSPAAGAIEGHCHDSSLILTEAAAPELEGNIVTITAGTGAGINTVPASANTSASWSIADGQVHMRLVLKPVRQTSQGLALQEVYPRLSSAFTGAYRFTDISLTIDSAATPFDFDAVQDQLAPGLYERTEGSRISGTLLFEGKLLWPETLQGLTVLFNEREHPVAGPLRLVNGVPQYALNARRTGVTIGHLALEIGLDLIGLLVDPREEDGPETAPDADAMHRLAGRLRLDRTGSVLPFETTWQIATPTAVELVSNGISGVSGFLRDVGAQLLDIEIPDWSTVEGLPWLETVDLTHMCIAFNVEALQLESVSTTFALPDTRRKLVLVPDLLTLDAIAVELVAIAGTEPDLEAVLTGNLTIQDASVTGPLDVTITLPAGTFRIGLGPDSTLDAGKLLHRLLPQLPESTTWVIGDLWIEGSRATRSFTFSAACEPGTSIDLLLFRLEELELSFEYFGADGVSTRSVQLKGALRISDEVTIAVSGAIDGDGWRLSGGLVADPPLTLSALLPKGAALPSEILACEVHSIEATVATGGGTKITFAVDSLLKLDFGETGQISTGAWKLEYASTAGGYEWMLEAAGGLKLVPTAGSKWFFDCAGTLRADGTKETAALHFDSDGCGFENLPLLIPAKIDAGTIEWSAVSFLVTGISLEKDDQGWHFASDLRLRLTRAFPQLMRIFPESGVEAELKVEKGTAAIHLKSAFVGIDVPDFSLPAIGDMPPFAMGESRVELGPLKLLLGGKALEVDCDVAFWLPEKINHLLGTDAATGKPKIELLDTFRRDAPGRAVRASFRGGYKAGRLDLGGSVSDLPLRPLHKEADGYVLHLGEITEGVGRYGSMKFAMPELKVDLEKGGLELAGEFELLKDFAIPMDALKAMFAAGSAADWASRLPDAVPIPYLDRPSLFDGNALNVAAIEAYYKKVFGLDLPATASDALKTLASLANRLPNALTKYLELPRPSAMKFKLDLRPDGSVDITVAATPDVKMVLFSPAAGVQGITLRSLSFGELFGGQLFSLRVDADVEQFDLLQLATALAIPDEAAWKYVGNPRQFGTRLALHELFMVIIWQTGIPIPVPLFYKHLGVEYYGLGDFAFQAAITFPQPSLDLTKIPTLLSDIVRFASDRMFALDEAKPYEALDLQLTVEPSYMTLPEVFGKSKHGLLESWKPPSFYQAFASVANGIKFFDAGALVTAIPLDQRFRTRDAGLHVTLAGADVAVESIVTTPRELLGAAREKLQLSDVDAMQWLAILPAVDGKRVTADHDGAILYLRGEWQTSYAAFELVAGVGSAGADQVRAGVRIRGSVNGIFDLEALALTRVENQPPYFTLSGASNTRLTLAGLPIFTGDTTLAATEHDFAVNGNFTLLDQNSIVYLGGAYNGHFGSGELSLAGAVTGRLLVFPLEGAGYIRNEGIGAEIGVPGSTQSGFAIYPLDDVLKISGLLHVGWTAFHIDASVAPGPFITIGLTARLADLIELALSVTGGGEGPAAGSFALDLFGLRVLTGTATVGPDAMEASGDFRCFLADGIGIAAAVTGIISASGFQFTGTGTLQVLLPPVSCSITVDTSGVRGSVSLAGVEYELSVVRCNGALIILLRGFNITSYIDSSGLHLNANPPCDDAHGLAPSGDSGFALGPESDSEPTDRPTGTSGFALGPEDDSEPTDPPTGTSGFAR